MDQATEFEATTQDVREHLTKAGEAATHVARAKMDDVREQAAALYERGREKADELNETATGFIKEQPFMSVMIAAGVGLLAGMFLARR